MTKSNIQNQYKNISIIIPVYNNQNCIKKLLDSLLELDYQKDNFEIILVDNNSTDFTKKIIKKYQVKLLEENNIQSSYAARNKGIKNAQYDILAFTDADCIVTKNWLKEGIMPMLNEEADLVGGKVEFIFSKEKTAAELYDSITHMNNDINIREKHTIATANMFVKKKIFLDIGFFPENYKSGGDFKWSYIAYKKKYKLVYQKKAIVKHPARKFKDLIDKAKRVSRGSIYYLSEKKINIYSGLIKAARYLLPPNYFLIRKKVRANKNVDVNELMILEICMVGYWFNLVKIKGILKNLLDTTVNYLKNYKISK